MITLVRNNRKVMANRWGIPKEIEELVIKRDTSCVYCRVNFDTSTLTNKARPTWEHIINDIKINGVDNIALCCKSCNSSKGAKSLRDWLESKYCKTRNIKEYSVATVVKEYLKKQ